MFIHQVEKVRITTPVTGYYSIIVSASILTESTTQLYAIAVTAGGYAVKVDLGTGSSSTDDGSDDSATDSPTRFPSPAPSVTPSHAPTRHR